MGRVSYPDKVMLFCSMIYQERAPKDQAISMMEDRFGKALMSTEAMQFNYTDYYQGEMGYPLYRMIIAFSRLIERDSMPELKIASNDIESRFLDQGKRTVNIDPGILTLENICLATTKPYTHRIYLGKGIWAEITLMYKGDSYQRLEWTYPDYASHELIEIFNGLRDTYRRTLKCHQA